MVAVVGRTAKDLGHVYWTAGSALYRAPIENASGAVMLADNFTTLLHVAVDPFYSSGAIYVTDFGDDKASGESGRAAGLLAVMSAWLSGVCGCEMAVSDGAEDP